MKILYLSQYFPPEMGAPAARVSELARHWVQEGHDVTVLTGFPNHPTGIVDAEYRGKLRRLLVRENWNDVSVIRTWLWPLPNRRAYERMLNYGSFAVSSAVAGLLASRPDVVIASSPQLLVGLSGWWVALCKRVPFVFEVRDLWPESLAAVGMGDPHSLLYRGLARTANFLYRNCDHIVVVTRAFKEQLITCWRVPPEKISVVENGVETELFAPREVPELRHELSAEQKFVVGYIGTIGMAHGLECLLEAAGRLQTVKPEVLFLLVGEGADKERIVNLARSRGLCNVHFVPQQPHDSIPAYISVSDACLVLLKKSELFKTVIPTKMLEFMSCARPVILAVDGEARKMLAEANAGIYVKPEDAGQLTQAILHLTANEAFRKTLGRNGRRYILANLSRRQTAQVYIDVLLGVTGKAGRKSSAAA